MGNNDAKIEILIQVFIVGICVYIMLPIIGFIIAKIIKVKKSQEGIYIFMTIFSNIGFMGFPVMKSIFGDESIFYTAIFNMIFNLLVFTLGIFLMSYGKEKKVKINPKDLLSPGIISSIIAILIFLLNIKMPIIISNTVQMVGNMTTPLAMIMIGSTLATINIKSIFTDKKIYIYTFIKQLLLPILAYPILKYSISNDLVLGITLIILAMPVGNSAVIFSYEYDGDIELAAKVIFITTALSVITIPAIVSIFLI